MHCQEVYGFNVIDLRDCVSVVSRCRNRLPARMLFLIEKELRRKCLKQKNRSERNYAIKSVIRVLLVEIF